MKDQYPLLLVDDEEIILTTIGKDLRGDGFDVVTCNSGASAIQLMQDSHFDIVLTDLMMENIDGVAVLKKAKELNPDVIVILITGYGSLASAVNALRLGANDYLLKPCNRTEMLMRVNGCIEKLELKRRIRSLEAALPICSVCRKIRDDEGRKEGAGDWLTVEDFLKRRAHLESTHGYCPSCVKKTEVDIDDFVTREVDINVKDLDP
jgi:DNA-binding NtrC family response regulator